MKEVNSSAKKCDFCDEIIHNVNDCMEWEFLVFHTACHEQFTVEIIGR